MQHSTVYIGAANAVTYQLGCHHTTTAHLCPSINHALDTVNLVTSPEVCKTSGLKAQKHAGLRQLQIEFAFAEGLGSNSSH